MDTQQTISKHQWFQGVTSMAGLIATLATVVILSRDAQIDKVQEWQETKDRKALESLVNSNLRMAKQIANMHNRNGIDNDDLMQSAIEGTIIAANKYKVGSPMAFSTYARNGKLPNVKKISVIISVRYGLGPELQKPYMPVYPNTGASLLPNRGVNRNPARLLDISGLLSVRSKRQCHIWVSTRNHWTFQWGMIMTHHLRVSLQVPCQPQKPTLQEKRGSCKSAIWWRNSAIL